MQATQCPPCAGPASSTCRSAVLSSSRITSLARLRPQQLGRAAARYGSVALPGRSSTAVAAAAAAAGAAAAATAAAAAAGLPLPASLSPAALLAAAPLAALALAVPDLGEGLEGPVQLAYLVTLLGFLVVGAFLVVRQVLIRRELEEAAKVLGDRVRQGEATAEDYFELGVILLRKKLFTQATKNLDKARRGWAGDALELAQVHNALGYALFNLEKVEEAVAQYREATALQPGYVTAWNNLGDALERLKRYDEALDAYREALAFDADNKVAQARADFCKTRLDRIQAR